MKKLEKSLQVSKLKHHDVKVKLSSGGVASVAVFDLDTMIKSLLTDERLVSADNFAKGLNVLTGKPEGVNSDLGEIHTGDAWEPARERFCGNVPHNMPVALVMIADNWTLICMVCYQRFLFLSHSLFHSSRRNQEILLISGDPWLSFPISMLDL